MILEKTGHARTNISQITSSMKILGTSELSKAQNADSIEINMIKIKGNQYGRWLKEWLRDRRRLVGFWATEGEGIATVVLFMALNISFSGLLSFLLISLGGSSMYSGKGWKYPYNPLRLALVSLHFLS